LEKVQQLPVEIQVGIARRVESCIKITGPRRMKLSWQTSLPARWKSRPRPSGGTMDPQWAAPAIAEAWCYATMSLSKGYLDRLHAQAIIGAIEAFTSSRLSS